MLTKSAATLLKNYSASQKMACALTQVQQRNFSGGGKKKPAISSLEMDFDIVFVGKYFIFPNVLKVE